MANTKDLKTIRQFRGLEANLPTLLEGQIGFTTDTKKLFIGSSDGNVLVSDREEIEAINNSLNTLIQDVNSIGVELESELGQSLIKTGLNAPAVNAGTYVKTDIAYIQVFIPKKSFILRQVNIRTTGTITSPVRVTAYELNEDNSIKVSVFDRFYNVSTGANTLDIDFPFRKGVKYGITQITSGTGTAVQRLNSANIGVYEDDYINVLGRVSTSNLTIDTNYWMYFYNWIIDTTLQAQVDYFQTNGAISTPTIVASTVPPSNPTNGTIWIEV